MLKNTSSNLKDCEFLLDIFPSPVLIINHAGIVTKINNAAAKVFGVNNQAVIMMPGGAVINCINAGDVGESCGNTEECKHCIFRNSFLKAMEGEKVVQNQGEIIRVENDREQYMQVMATASLFSLDSETNILLVIEDISELSLLRKILPICSDCKKIRNDDDYWQSVEEYMANNLHLKFTHGLCPDCAEKY